MYRLNTNIVCTYFDRERFTEIEREIMEIFAKRSFVPKRFSIEMKFRCLYDHTLKIKDVTIEHDHSLYRFRFTHTHKQRERERERRLLLTYTIPKIFSSFHHSTTQQAHTCHICHTYIYNFYIS